MAITPADVHSSLARHMLVDGFDFVIDLDKSQGNRFHDSRSGRDVMDFFTCFASLAVGWNHPDMKAAEAELGRIAVNNVANSDLYTVEMAEAVDAISSIAMPAEMDNLFMVAGGALAIENSLKISMDWKMNDRLSKGLVDTSTPHEGDGFCWSADMRESNKVKIGHFREAFHGRSGYTMSLTNTDPTKTKGFSKFDWPRFHNPSIRFPLDSEEEVRLDEAEDRSIEGIRSAAADDPDSIASIIIEPIQGEGGDNHFRPEYMKRLSDTCKEIGALFIVDEVQTGAGATGKMWAYQHTQAEPDILAFGKKMQIGGVMAKDSVKEFEDNPFQTSSRINSTFGGNLIDMVRCAMQLEIIERDGLVENAARRGEELMAGLHELGDSFEMISNVRGQGLMAAFTLPDINLRNSLRSAIYDGGAHVLNSGFTSIRLRPSLTISSDEVDEALNIFESAAKSLQSSQIV
jgi:L-lysine 6-transaminase